MMIKNIARIIFLSALVCLHLSSLQAAPPDAGTLLENIKPLPTPMPDETKIIPKKKKGPAVKLDDKRKIGVSSIRVTGATAVSGKELQTLVGDAAGRELTLAGLQGYADRITRHYRHLGYLLAHAYLPSQEIRNGIVEIVVLEGRMDKLHLDNRSTITDSQVLSRLSGLKTGEVLSGPVLERSMLVLQDLPGVDPNLTLRPGDSVGTCNLDLRMDPKPLYSGRIELDNYGNSYVGKTRLAGSVNAGNLTGLLDVLNLGAMASKDLAYGRFDWELPVGSSGTKAGAAGSYMHYRLGEEFADLDAFGTAATGQLYLQYPIIRARSKNLRARLQYEYRHLLDEVETTDTKTRKAVNAISLDLFGDCLDGLLNGGINQGGIALVAGDLDMDADSIENDRDGYQTAGTYMKLGFNGTRLQRLPEGFSLVAALRGQLAGKNLDSSEKMSLGGPRGVRAYPAGEASSDHALLTTLELGYQLHADCQARLFYDHARGWLHRDPHGNDSGNSRKLSGYGLGLSYDYKGFSLGLDIAWRSGELPTSEKDRSPRVWAQIIKQF